MAREAPTLPTSVRRALRGIGSDIRDARRRRRLLTAVLANRAGITLPTLRRVERGDPAVSFGIYANVLYALGLLDKLISVASAQSDVVGLALEEERLPQRVRRRRGEGGASSSPFPRKPPPKGETP
jgi:transcriptional regulator with XRE-family HTH domain